MTGRWWLTDRHGTATRTQLWRWARHRSTRMPGDGPVLLATDTVRETVITALAGWLAGRPVWWCGPFRSAEQFADLVGRAGPGAVVAAERFLPVAGLQRCHWLDARPPIGGHARRATAVLVSSQTSGGPAALTPRRLPGPTALAQLAAMPMRIPRWWRVRLVALLSCPSMGHGAAALLACWISGTALVDLHRSPPTDHLVAEVDLVTGLPRQLAATDLVRWPQLRTVVSGSAPLPRHLLREWLAAGLSVVDSYGSTETGPISAAVHRPGDAPGHDLGEPLPGVRVRVDQPGPDGCGDLLVRTPLHPDWVSPDRGRIVDGMVQLAWS